MSDLASKKCIPCEGNIPPFNTEEIHKYLKQVDGWEVIEDKIDGFHLIKNFKFDDFLQSQEFVNKVGEIAETEGHHPDLWFGWGNIPPFNTEEIHKYLKQVMQELKYLLMQLKVLLRELKYLLILF